MAAFFDLIYDGNPTKFGSRTAFATAIVTWLGGLFAIIAWSILGATSAPKEPYNGQWLNSTYLVEVWNFRNKSVDIQITSDFFTSLALFLFLYTIFIVFQLYRTEKGHTRHFMLFCFVAGAGIAAFGFLQSLGANVFARTVSETKGFANLPFGIGLISLTIAFQLSQSLGWYIFAADTALVSIGLLLTFWIQRKSTNDEKHKLDQRHGYLALGAAFIGLFSVLFEIIANLSDGWNRGVGITFVIFQLLFHFILMPAWTFWLGMQLRNKEIPLEDGPKKETELISKD